MNRRSFFRKAGLAAVGVVLAPGIVRAIIKPVEIIGNPVVGNVLWDSRGTLYYLSAFDAFGEPVLFPVDSRVTSRPESPCHIVMSAFKESSI